MTDLTTLKTGAVTVAAQAILTQPEFLRLRRIAIGTMEWRGKTLRYIASGLKLTDEDRKTASRLCAELHRLCSVGDENHAREERYRVIAKMLLAKPAPNACELTGAARSEAYQESLDDVPPWAVTAVAKQWYRGECGEQEYTWAPRTDVWRKLALALIEPYRREIFRLEALLQAEPFDDTWLLTEPNAKPKEAAKKPPVEPIEPGYSRRAIIDRIQKLWALGSSNPNAAEAASAKERALALMAQHNISTADLGPTPSVFELDPANWEG
jgi:hypothetical protein